MFFAGRRRPRVLVRSRGSLDHGQGVCDVVGAFDRGVRGHATKRRSNRGLKSEERPISRQLLIFVMFVFGGSAFEVCSHDFCFLARLFFAFVFFVLRGSK